MYGCLQNPGEIERADARHGRPEKARSQRESGSGTC